MWTEEKLEFLKRNVNMPIKDIALALNLSEDNVRNKRHRLGLSKSKRVRYTQDERNIIAKYYGVVSKEELMEMLPGRTWNSICKQVTYLRERGWSIERYKRKS